jgi:hypothetical protein
MRDVCGAVVTESDLQILSRCNRDFIWTLERIVGTSIERKPVKHSAINKELTDLGKVWSEHVLENVKAYGKSTDSLT